MEPQSNARDWQARLRSWAALIICVFELGSIAVSSAALVSGAAARAVYDSLFWLHLVFPLYSVGLYTHMALGLWKFYQRNTLKMARWEAAQLLLGMSIPLFILTPTIALMLVDARFGLGGVTAEQYFVAYPEIAWRTLGAFAVIGVHAFIGVRSLLRLRPWYPRVKWGLLVVFVVAVGAACAGNLRTTSWQVFAAQQTFTPEQLAALRWTDLGVSALLVALYGMLVVARALRVRLRSSMNTVLLEYAGGRQIAVPPATTLLEASRIAGIPHPSICGGRARCTTCRVRVDEGMDHLSPVGEREHKALVRIGAAEDIRLACQAEGRGGSVRITILLPQTIPTQTARRETRDSVGRDVELAVMFVDLRGFTSLSHTKFPYDVVYILNNYFESMGTVIEAAGGRVDKFLGDGILAYFGLDQDPHDGCRAALKACREMARSLDDLNRRLSHVLPEGLKLGIGLHFGDLVLGEIGFRDRRQVTIIGDTVNMASRLEGLNKTSGSQLILSTRVAALGGVDLSSSPVATVKPRGAEQEQRVYVIKDIVQALAALE